MISHKRSPPPWRFDARFWATHLVVPLVVAGALLTLMEQSAIDLWLADRWFAMEGHRWALRDHWLTYDVIHHHGKQMIIGLGLVVFTLIVQSFRAARLSSWRLPLSYVLTSMIVLPVLITRAKHFSPVPCPWDLTRYGGDIVYQHTFSYSPGVAAFGHCFPSGHCSGGFALLAIYFAAYPYTRRPALFLLPGLVVGVIFALGQQARGGHFLSHDLWTLSLCWFGALALFLLFLPQHWPGPRKFD